MTLKKAQEIAHALSIAHAKYGAQLRSPYPQHEIIEALDVIIKDRERHNQIVNATWRKEVATANRRAGAAVARLKRCMGKDYVEEEPPADPDVNNDGLKD